MTADPTRNAPSEAVAIGRVKLTLADTGEVHEWPFSGTEDGYVWEETALRLALNLVPMLEEAIDRARLRGEAIELHTRTEKWCACGWTGRPHPRWTHDREIDGA